VSVEVSKKGGSQPLQAASFLSMSAFMLWADCLFSSSVLLRISAIVDADFRLIVDGKTALSETRQRGAQVLD
jgi:hypothetical protein